MRWIQNAPEFTYFKPQGMPMRMLTSVLLEMDELEALRLADLHRLNQEEAAQEMNVSRPTFGRIVSRARGKVADALVNGKAIQIEGGSVIERPICPSGRGKGRKRHGWK